MNILWPFALAVCAEKFCALLVSLFGDINEVASDQP